MTFKIDQSILFVITLFNKDCFGAETTLGKQQLSCFASAHSALSR